MYIATALAVVVVAVFISLGLFGMSGTTSTPPESAQAAAQALLDEIAQTGTVAELRVVDTVEGQGVGAKAGDTLTVHYTGVLPDGTMFDSSVARNSPIVVVLGMGEVIKGWDQGLVGMKAGGTRLLAIPPALGYGGVANGLIPPNSTLLFQVELVSITPAP